MKRLPTVPCRFLPPATTARDQRREVRQLRDDAVLLRVAARAGPASRGRRAGSRSAAGRSARPAGAVSRISSGCACAYVSDWLIAVAEAPRGPGCAVIQLVQRAVAADRPEPPEHRPRRHHGARAVDVERLREERLGRPDRVDLAVARAPSASRGTAVRAGCTEFGLTPTFCSAALIITSPTPLSALTAIVLPGRSAGVRIELDALDEDVLPVVRLVRALDLAGRDAREWDPLRAPDDHGHAAEVADVAVVVRDREDDVVAALQRPLVDLDPLRLEEALLIPRSIGSAFAIGSVLTVTVDGLPAAWPARSPQAPMIATTTSSHGARRRARGSPAPPPFAVAVPSCRFLLLAVAIASSRAVSRPSAASRPARARPRPARA